MDDVYRSARITNLVRYLAVTMVNKYPYAEFEDVCQDLWLEIFKVLKNDIYDKNRTARLETFLFRHLWWRVQNWVRLGWLRQNLLQDYVQQNQDRNVTPIEECPEQLCLQVKAKLGSAKHKSAKLKAFEQDVFDQYVNPDPELIQIAMSDVPYEVNNFNQTHLARYFGVSQTKIYRAMKAIKKATKDVVKG